MYAARRNPGRLLIVCPKTLMRTGWGLDIDKFTPQFVYAIADAEHREEAFTSGAQIVIINTDGVRWFFDKGKPIAARIKLLKDFDHLIIDEITAYKHRTTGRSKDMAKLRKFFTHRYGLTGTPNPNSVTELWHQAFIIDDGKRLGLSFSNFRNSTQVPTQIGPDSHHLRWDDKPGIEAAVHALLADITIRHEFEKVMSHVPPNHRETKLFQLSRKAQAAYDTLENQSFLQLQNGHVSAVHAAAVRTKLLQIASGAVYASLDDDSSYTVIDTSRYDLIADLTEEVEHSVTFFVWKHQREQLAKLLTARGVKFAVIDGSVPQKKRDEIVTAYQNGEYANLLLHPRTGAHGLTLTRGTRTILASPIYEADYFRQLIARIYRGGQTKVTNTVCVCAERTVEELVYERLFAKETRMDDLLELLRLRRA